MPELVLMRVVLSCLSFFAAGLRIVLRLLLGIGYSDGFGVGMRQVKGWVGQCGLLAVCVLLFACGSGSGGGGVVSSSSNAVAVYKTPVERYGQLQVCARRLCDERGEPVQLRGMSTHGIQWYGWDDCLTEGSLNALADDWRADILRISLYVQEGGYQDDPTGYTEQVGRLIDEATERGMYALIDWHQLTPGDPNLNFNLAVDFFTDIATRYAGYNNIIYDVANEPNNVSWAAVQSYAMQIIPIIRDIDSDAVVLVGTHGWASLGVSDGGSAQAVVDNPVTIDNIMYTFHFYAASHGQAYRDNLEWALQRLPIFVTEWGAQTYTGDGANDFVSAQAYLDLLAQYSVSWTSWNYSDDVRSGAVWRTGTCRAGGPWTEDQLKPAGQWVRGKIRNRT